MTNFTEFLSLKRHKVGSRFLDSVFSEFLHVVCKFIFYINP